MSAPTCVGEPISWLRLEVFARGERDPVIASHVAACAACRRCLAEIQTDVVALPPLAVPGRAGVPRWWARLMPVFALAAAAMLALVIWRGREHEPAPREDLTTVKGVGEVVVGVVRERAGVIRTDVRAFAPGDRWKVVVTCPPAASASVVVEVTEIGVASVDHPLAPAAISCGNRVVVPGAFTLTGTRAHRVCARITAGESAGSACVTLTRE